MSHRHDSLPGAVTASASLGRVDELDGLRGLLALWVAASHIFCWCSFSQFPIQLPHYLKKLVSWFWVQFSFAGSAVDVFIVLSGFAISFLLHSRRQSYRQFMLGRFFRIYPVYFLCLLAGFATIYLMPGILQAIPWPDDDYFTKYVYPVVHAEQAQPATHLAAHLTLLFGVIPEKLFPHAAFTFVAPAWSITLEWQFYLVAPLIVYYVRRPAGLLVLGLIGSGEYIYSHIWTAAFLPDRLPLFLIGIGSFYLYANKSKFIGLPYRLHIFAAVLAGVLILNWHLVALLVWTMVFGGVMADGSNRGEHFLLWPKRLLLKPLLQFIGAISYPLYLVHWPVIVGLMALLFSVWPGISAPAALGIMLGAGLPVILFAAWVLHKLVEKPLMQYGKRFTR